MKRFIRILLVIFLIGGAFIGGLELGHKQGEQDVINNQIITNKKGQDGNYYSIYNDDVYEYYYEG